MLTLLNTIDRTDSTNNDALNSLKCLSKELAYMLRNHTESENKILLPTLANKLNQEFSSTTDLNEHNKLDQKIDTLLIQIQELSPSEFTDKYEKVRQAANLLVPELLIHMQNEENRLLPLFWQHFTDDELNQIHTNVMSTLTPEHTLLWFKYIVSALSPNERAQLIQLLKESVPNTFFNKLMAVAKQQLSTEDFSSISTI